MKVLDVRIRSFKKKQSEEAVKGGDKVLNESYLG